MSVADPLIDTPPAPQGLSLKQLIPRLKLYDRIFFVVGLLSTLIGVVTVVILLAGLIRAGYPSLNWSFLTHAHSVLPANAGIKIALIGSLMVIFVTVMTSVPLGVGAAVYLEEYASKNWLTSLIELNISNLAGVPSIVYGIMASSLIVSQMRLGPSVSAGGITLALLVLPVIIVATREALRTVPQSIREAAFAMGATKWQVIYKHLLPYSAGGIATGVIIAVSRAIGETAPLLLLGVIGTWRDMPPSPVGGQFPFVNFNWLNDVYSAVPILMYDWMDESKEIYQKEKAAAAGVVLIGLTLALNSAAMYIRYRVRKNIHW